MFDLQQRGKARISISTRFDDTRLVDGTSLALTVHDCARNNNIKILIDLNDNRNFAVSQALDDYDVIVKRGFLGSELEKLDKRHQGKVIPYGINYNCGSSSVPILQLFTYHHLMRLRLLGGARSRKHKISMQHQLRFLFYVRKNNLSLHESDFIARPDSPTSHGIFFITRLFISSKGLTDFSRQRIDLVKALKKEFGANFYGGIVRNQMTERFCPKDLLISKVSRRQFTHLLKSSDIAINTLGVGQSNPWKLGEALAAARCIVTEPLVFGIPQPLREDVNIKSFSSIDDCLTACEDLLSTPGKIRWMKESNWKYYQDNVRSETLIEKLLNRSFSVTDAVSPLIAAKSPAGLSTILAKEESGVALAAVDE
ncbi:MAG: hypothetical protein IPK65_00320 [Gammaproteobacteria bacterium]|nr:hypothetical protein [Gammaproteobacteria bacterium]